MKQLFIIFGICLLSMVPLLVSCRDSQPGKPPVNLTKKSKAIQIPFNDRGCNQVWIPVSINGVTMDMLYDTGFNGTVSMSLLELQTLYKNGRFSANDILGSSSACIADGSIVENGVVVLRSLKITNNMVIENVSANVVLNQEAPILLGREVFNDIARKVEVDDENKTLNITPW